MAGGLPAGGSGQGTEGRNLCRGCSSKDKASLLSKMHPLIDLMNSETTFFFIDSMFSI